MRITISVAFALLATSASAQQYQGPGADWVALLLSRASGWSCPGSPNAPTSAVAPTAAANRCVRDTYVNSALQAAWGAECEARANRTTAAYGDESIMASSLQAAASLCSTAPYVSSSGLDTSCVTTRFLSCSDLAPFITQPQTSSSIEQQALQVLQNGPGSNAAQQDSFNIPAPARGDVESQALINLQTSATQLTAEQQAEQIRQAQALAANPPARASRTDVPEDNDAASNTSDSGEDQTSSSSGISADDVVNAFNQGMQRGQGSSVSSPPAKPAQQKTPKAPTKPASTAHCTGAGNAVTGEQACSQ